MNVYIYDRPIEKQNDVIDNTTQINIAPLGNMNILGLRMRGAAPTQVNYLGFNYEQVCKQEKAKVFEFAFRDKINTILKNNPSIYSDAVLTEGQIVGRNIVNSQIGKGSVLQVGDNGSANNAIIGKNSRVHVFNCNADNIKIGDNVFVYLRNVHYYNSCVGDYCFVSNNADFAYNVEAKIKSDEYLKQNINLINNFYCKLAFELWKGHSDKISPLSKLPIKLIKNIALEVLTFD